jgi:hypothetical protein
MKKFTFALFLITALVVGAFCQNGIIRELSGEVELKPVGATDFARASTGDTVALNTIVSTGFRSTAIIAVGNSLITVRPLTRLSLAEIQSSGNTENVNLSLQAGRIRVDVSPPAGTRTNLTVQTPNATASVRGTSFAMDTVSITVSEGRVSFGGTSGPAVMVSGGNASFVAASGTSANPAEVAAATLAPASPVGAPSPDAVAQPSESAAASASGIRMIMEYRP